MDLNTEDHILFFLIRLLLFHMQDLEAKDSNQILGGKALFTVKIANFRIQT